MTMKKQTLEKTYRYDNTSPQPQTGNEESASIVNNTNTNVNTNDNKNTSSISSIRMVVQRYRKASLLINEKDYVTVGEDVVNGNGNVNDNNNAGHIGMLVYMSFSKTATPEVVQRAAKSILNLPIQTEGEWGDGSSTKSILQAAAVNAAQQHTSSSVSVLVSANCNVSIMLVPQANLIAKVKKNGKSVQYRDQIDKIRGEELYNLFVQSVKEILIENQKQHHNDHNNMTSKITASINTEKNKGNNNNKNSTIMTAVDPSIPPNELFQYRQQQQQQQRQNANTTITNTSLLYGSFDKSTGLPLTTSDGQHLTKSANKRIKKQYDAHTKRHEKYLLKQEKQQKQHEKELVVNTTTTASAAADNNNTKNIPKLEAQDDKQQQQQGTTDDKNCNNNNNDGLFVRVIAGSFGKRQGLKFVSDMGPFCHVIEL